jgi:hypothetical protein
MEDLDVVEVVNQIGHSLPGAEEPAPDDRGATADSEMADENKE